MSIPLPRSLEQSLKAVRRSATPADRANAANCLNYLQLGHDCVAATDYDLTVVHEVPGMRERSCGYYIPNVIEGLKAAGKRGVATLDLDAHAIEFPNGRVDLSTKRPDTKDLLEIRTTLPPGPFAMVDAATFTNALCECTYFHSDDRTRANICGVFLRINGDTLELSATDGHRAHVVRQIPCSGTLHETAILSGPEGVDGLAHALHGAKGSLAIALDSMSVTFVQDHMFVRVRQCADNYPNLDRVTPKGPWAVEITLDAAEWLHRVKRQAAIDKVDGNKVSLVRFRVSTLEGLQPALVVGNDVWPATMTFDKKAVEDKVAEVERVRFKSARKDQAPEPALEPYRLFAFSSSYLREVLELLGGRITMRSLASFPFDPWVVTSDRAPNTTHVIAPCK